jgi:platelet-activating factor acetylhydrolase
MASFYTVGFVRFLKVPTFISYLATPILSCFKKPAHYEADVYQHKFTFPICIFSHGLGGMRTAYSGLCGNLASKGFLVVGIEFRDNSAARTVFIV